MPIREGMRVLRQGCFSLIDSAEKAIRWGDFPLLVRRFREKGEKTPMNVLSGESGGASVSWLPWFFSRITSSDVTLRRFFVCAAPMTNVNNSADSRIYAHARIYARTTGSGHRS